MPPTKPNAAHGDEIERGISDVAREFRFSPAQLSRWLLRGAKTRAGQRIFPEATRTPAGWRISRRALREFLDRLTADARSTEATPTVLAREEHETAVRALEAVGL
jgi:hypothetical protein